MGSTESTGRSNATEEQEEERQPENRSSGGGSMGAGTAVAIAAAGTVMAAWGISRMISDSSDSEKKEKDDAMKMKAHETESSFSNFPIHESILYEAEGKETKSWSPPPVGLFKMNTDAVCKGTKESDERGPSWYGGILRNDRGEWVRGFQGFIPLADIFTAEINGIYNGLKLLDKPEYRGSILETDHQGAVKSINKPEKYTDKHQIIEDIRSLAREYDITIVHVPRSANRCADQLARMAVNDKCKLELQNLPENAELESRYYQDLESCKLKVMQS